MTAAGVLGSRAARGSSEGSLWRRVDFSLALVTVVISCFGLLIVYSASRGNGAVPDTTQLDRQMTFAFIGLGLMACLMMFDYRRLRDLAVLGYAGTMVLLLAVLVLGVEVKGAKAWFRVGPLQMQPSEFGKIAVIVALATFFTADRSEPSARRMLVGLVITALPAGVIMLQPDLGTVLVYLMFTVAIFVVAGVRSRHLLVLALVVVLGAGVSLPLLESYQVDRLTAFIDNKPTEDNKAVFAHQKNAQTAIGNGGLFGQGLFDGSQNNSKLVSEKQTDFIFTVVGEEFGFFGGAALLACYAFMILRIWRIGSTAPDAFGTLICVGVLAMLVFQIFENIGMAAGIMPITGIPLPFLSYGGSSILAYFIGIGLVESIHMRRFA
jgi:rod shape determining protein RodA